jgi:hypothetical protein
MEASIRAWEDLGTDNIIENLVFFVNTLTLFAYRMSSEIF